MKKLNKSVVSAIGLALALWGLQPALGANYLTNIGVARDGDSVVVSVTTSLPGEYNVFLTDKKPERIVIDLDGVINNLSPSEFRELPLKTVGSIRTSQFKTSPDLQARVVLDIGHPIYFRNYRDGNRVFVKFPAVAGEGQFAAWQSSGSGDITQSPAEEPPVEAVKPPVKDLKPPVEAASAEPKALPETEVTSASSNATDEDDVAANIPAEETPLASALPVVAPQGVVVDTTTKRKTVAYEDGGSRDPFIPLIGAGGGKMSRGLPSLENLKLVGILSDTQGNRALLEDSNGDGYILSSNDRIRNGYLMTVTESKAVFQVTEYGWSRTVALELNIPDMDKGE